VPGGAALDPLQLDRPAPQQGPRNTLAVPGGPGPRPQLGPIGYVKYKSDHYSIMLTSLRFS
jgi:hypothetical protein